jgi:hypothetical protein
MSTTNFTDTTARNAQRKPSFLKSRPQPANTAFDMSALRNISNTTVLIIEKKKKKRKKPQFSQSEQKVTCTSAVDTTATAVVTDTSATDTTATDKKKLKQRRPVIHSKSLTVESEILSDLDVTSISDLVHVDVETIAPGFSRLLFTSCSTTHIGEAFTAISKHYEQLRDTLCTEDVELPFYLFTDPTAKRSVTDMLKMIEKLNVVISIEQKLNVILEPGTTTSVSIARWQFNSKRAISLLSDMRDSIRSSPLGLYQQDMNVCEKTTHKLFRRSYVNKFEKNHKVIVIVSPTSLKNTDKVSIVGDTRQDVLSAVKTLIKTKRARSSCKQKSRYADMKARELYYRRQRQGLCIDVDIIESFGRASNSLKLEQLTMMVPQNLLTARIDYVLRVGISVGIELDEKSARIAGGYTALRITGVPNDLAIAHDRVTTLINEFLSSGFALAPTCTLFANNVPTPNYEYASYPPAQQYTYWYQQPPLLHVQQPPVFPVFSPSQPYLFQQQLLQQQQQSWGM